MFIHAAQPHLRGSLALLACFASLSLSAAEPSAGGTQAISSSFVAPHTAPKRLGSDLKWRRIWLASIAVHGAGTAFDAYSSYHRGPYELNSFLADSDKQFGNKAVMIKGGMFAGTVALEFILLRLAAHRDTRLARTLTKTFAICNFSAGATYFSAGAHNYAVLSKH